MIGFRIIHGDCLDVLEEMPENSVDAVVTDPPYHLHAITKRFAKTGGTDKTRTTSGPHQRVARGFMNKLWDGGNVAFRVVTWEAMLRVLKPGGYLLAFGSTRGFGRMSVAIEDSGFITHPFIAWVYGSGFPKATRIKAAGYDGFRYGGQALKPAVEPIYMGQKPFEYGLSGTQNILKWGTGAINVDACRVAGKPWKAHSATGLAATKFFTEGEAAVIEKSPHDLGRWPANLIHDGSDEVLAAFPETADSKPGTRNNNNQGHEGWSGGTIRSGPLYSGHADSGSAARFFYCAKASRDDRNDGLDGFDKKPLLWSSGTQNPGSFQSADTEKAARNNHPTVKPTALMRYLCRLVTPPGGSILDPFCGSGSTGKAALLEGFGFIGIESEAEYVEIAKARVTAAAGVFA